jgi:hypothetical protein
MVPVRCSDSRRTSSPASGVIVPPIKSQITYFASHTWKLRRQFGILFHAESFVLVNLKTTSTPSNGAALLSLCPDFNKIHD